MKHTKNLRPSSSMPRTGLIRNGKRSKTLKSMATLKTLVSISMISEELVMPSLLFLLMHLFTQRLPRFSLSATKPLTRVKTLTGAQLNHLPSLLLLMKVTMFVYLVRMLREVLSHIDMLMFGIKIEMDSMFLLMLLLKRTVQELSLLATRT